MITGVQRLGRSGPAGPPSGVRHVDAICDAFAEQDRLAKISELSWVVANLQADRDAEIARLKAEVERLQAELKKAESSAITTADQE